MSGLSIDEQRAVIENLRNQYFDELSKFPRDSENPYTDEWDDHQGRLNAIHQAFKNPADLMPPGGLFGISHEAYVLQTYQTMLDEIVGYKAQIVQYILDAKEQAPADFDDRAKQVYVNHMAEKFQGVTAERLRDRSLNTLQKVSQLVGQEQVALVDKINKVQLIKAIIPLQQFCHLLKLTFNEAGVDVPDCLQAIVFHEKDELDQMTFAQLSDLFKNMKDAANFSQNQLRALADELQDNEGPAGPRP